MTPGWRHRDGASTLRWTITATLPLHPADSGYAVDRARGSCPVSEGEILTRGILVVQTFLAPTVMALMAVNLGGPSASAQPCPDIGVAFARGTSEPVGVGAVGQAFVDSVRAQAFPRTVGVHGVNYPASSDFFGPGFTQNVATGARDVLDHIRGVVSVCPQTQMIVGGYSQGAMVSAFATSDVLPAGLPPEAAPTPLPPEIADHVAAVVLFGRPNGPALVKYGVPALGASPPYAAKLLELCAPGDSVCAGDPAAPVDPAAHGQYAANGMVGSAAAFAVSRIPPAPPPLPPLP